VGFCNKGKFVSKRVKSGGDYYDQYQYLTPQQLARKRKQNQGKIWCTGCDNGRACPKEEYFKCAKRIQLGL